MRQLIYSAEYAVVPTNLFNTLFNENMYARHAKLQL